MNNLIEYDLRGYKKKKKKQEKGEERILFLYFKYFFLFRFKIFLQILHIKSVSFNAIITRRVICPSKRVNRDGTFTR